MGSRKETAIKTKVIPFSGNIESKDNVKVALVSKCLNKKEVKLTLEQTMKGTGRSIAIIFTSIYNSTHVCSTFTQKSTLGRLTISVTDAQTIGSGQQVSMQQCFARGDI